VRREASRWLARLDGLEGEWRPGGAAARAQVAEARARLLRLRFGAREGWAPPQEVFAQAREARRVARKATR
jgi:hypothetical protein